MDLIDRNAVLRLPRNVTKNLSGEVIEETIDVDRIKRLPSVEPERRYTDEELSVFKHGISLSLLSKRSSQHWKYDENTATEIKFLERLYEKVVADMRGEQE